MLTLIGMLLPIAFAAGIAMRKPVPNVASIPTELAKSRDLFNAIVWERRDSFTKVPISVRLLRQTTNTGNYAISLRAPKDFVKPDLLVYWLPPESIIKDTIPDEATLLGGFDSDSPLALPPFFIGKPGVLVLYSLADQQIVESSKQLSL